MKLLSPLAGQWDTGRGAYSWAKLEDMAALMGLEFPDAHDAAADVTATISVMRWAYDQTQRCMIRVSCPEGRFGLFGYTCEGEGDGSSGDSCRPRQLLI